MLYLLLENEKIPTPKLAIKLGVSVRTVFRYVESLSQAGFPVYVLKGRNGGVALLPEFKLNNVLVDKDEQTNILASLQSMKTFNLSDDETLSKLSSIFKEDPISWIKIDPTAWSRNEDYKKDFAILRQAILQSQFIVFKYINAQNEISNRLVYPYYVVFKDHAWYLKGYSMERKASRTFKLVRMSNLRVSATPDNKEKPWLNNQDGQYHLDKMIKVKLLIDHTLKYRIYEEFSKNEVLEQDSGNFIVTTELEDDSWLMTYLISYGSHLRVIEPLSLKNKVKQGNKTNVEKILNHDKLLS
jgi:Predicted transcriptional regulator